MLQYKNKENKIIVVYHFDEKAGMVFTEFWNRRIWPNDSRWTRGKQCSSIREKGGNKDVQEEATRLKVKSQKGFNTFLSMICLQYEL